ncbi:MAG TPA: hypothetical protein VF523_08270 [Burkholderiales bacterium]
MQNLIAYSIVAVAIAYAGWLFMPRFLHRWLLVRLIALLPVRHRARFAHLPSASQTAGCSTCKGCEEDAPAATRTIRIHRR